MGDLRQLFHHEHAQALALIITGHDHPHFRLVLSPVFRGEIQSPVGDDALVVVSDGDQADY
ncbi:MAG: hypothetical protein KKC69_04015, partial [Acidobacteria bacterium]|nr:hypothetical protein [Acidobacteriota bacterium]